MSVLPRDCAVSRNSNLYTTDVMILRDKRVFPGRTEILSLAYRSTVKENRRTDTVDAAIVQRKYDGN